MDIERIHVTPAVAENLRRTVTDRQRRESASHVATLAQAMSNGTFVDTGEPLQQDSDGRLINGWHRLSAVIASGVPQWFVIVRGIDPKAFAYIDIGRRRSASQFISHAYGGAIVNAARLLMLLESTDYEPTSFAAISTKANIEDVLSYVDKHPAVVDTADDAMTVYRQCRIHAGTHLALLTMAVENGHPITTWVSDLTTGDNMRSATDPRFLLRDRWLRDWRQLNVNSSATMEHRWALLVKAWNATVSGRAMGSLKYRYNEVIPMPFWR